MRSYSALIDELLMGDNPKSKYEHLQELLKISQERNRAIGRLHFVEKQIDIVSDNTSCHWTKGYLTSIKETLNSPL